jgi:hypothetical protein
VTDISRSLWQKLPYDAEAGLRHAQEILDNMTPEGRLEAAQRYLAATYGPDAHEQAYNWYAGGPIDPGGRDRVQKAVPRAQSDATTQPMQEAGEVDG